MESRIQTLQLRDIRLDGGTQIRDEIDRPTAEGYAEMIGDGAKFPPIVVFHDASEGAYWMGDGFHRWHAHQIAGLSAIDCEVVAGTLRDATLYAAGANATHGRQRSTQDKRNAVSTLLNDPEWARWSDREIARRCGVGNRLVGDVRRELSVSGHRPGHGATRRFTRNGKIHEVNVENIGKGRAGDDGIAAQIGQLPARNRLSAESRATFDDDARFYFAMTAAPEWGPAITSLSAFVMRESVVEFSAGRNPASCPFLGRLIRALKTKHPRDWSYCPSCDGGNAKGESDCRECRGYGYKID